MRRWLTIALSGLVLSCQGPAAVMAREAAASSVAGPPVMIQSVVRD
jgi:hypothetical protein